MAHQEVIKGEEDILRLIYYMHKTSGISLEEAAGAAGDFTMGLVTALRHPEWAQAFTRLISIDSKASTRWLDDLVNLIPVHYVSP